MNPTDPRQQAALDAAVHQIKTTVSSVADRVSDLLGTMSLSATRISERDLMLSAQFELRRNMASFHLVFRDQLRESINKEIAPREDGRRRLEATDWHSLSLVDDQEVEQRLYADRIGAQIAQECEWEQRELAAYMGARLKPGRADEDRNPLRPAVLGLCLYRSIESVSKDADSRKLLARELGLSLAKAMKPCYAEILRDLQARGVKPVSLSLRAGDGPGFHLPGVNSGYATLQPSEYRSTGSPGVDLSGFGESTGHPDSGHAGGGGSGYGRGPGLAGLPPRPGGPVSTRSGAPSQSGAGGSRYATMSRAELGSRVASAQAQADAHLMNLLRRLTAMASRPGELDALPPGDPTRAYASTGRPGLAGPASGNDFPPITGPAGGSAAGGNYAEGLTGLMAVNLIRAHREELVQASSGKLDHMVIDVVGSLFDQILSDPRVPPQMARQIARLQLPVLRVALNDSSFFSSRRHPVRRFVNRIASLACAFDDFGDGPGKEFLARVRELVQEIVEGDFDQIEIYTAKLQELEQFIGQQTQAQVQQSPAAATLEGKESELRIQQRYMLQLTAAFKPLPLPPYLREFLSQVWSQALVLAVRRDGAASDRFARFKRAGRDLVMSVQPKGSPALRKKFLMQLPQLMKDLNEGMALIGWPEAAQKGFFAQLLPAHAESLKGQALSTLEHNLLVKRVDGALATPMPCSADLPALNPGSGPAVAALQVMATPAAFTPAEAQAIGLVDDAAVDWAGAVDIDLSAEPELTASDLAITGLPAPEAVEPTSGKSLADHVQIGFAYQMQLQGEWQKVRLAHVSTGRSFFVFTHGAKQRETVSMTHRMLVKLCGAGRLRAMESAYLLERATARARRQLEARSPPRSASGAPPQVGVASGPAEPAPRRLLGGVFSRRS